MLGRGFIYFCTDRADFFFCFCGDVLCVQFAFFVSDRDADMPTAEEAEPAAASTAAPANPDGICKCFVGNLSWDIDDDGAKEFFKDCGDIEDLFWLTDKESGKFKGAGFITFSSPGRCPSFEHSETLPSNIH